MIDYVRTKECRSIFINHYFGDSATKTCGICDNCLRVKATHLTTEEFEKIKTSIHNVLSSKAISSVILLEKLSGVNREKAWSVLNFLQAEQKIIVDEKGEISLP